MTLSLYSLTHLCGWKCVSSCLTFGGTSSRSTGTGKAACPSGWAGAWIAWRSAWSFCRKFCSWSSSPVKYVKCQLWRPQNIGFNNGYKTGPTTPGNVSRGLKVPVFSSRPTCEWTALCWSKLTACPKVFPQIPHSNGRVPLCERRTWTSNPWGVENTFGKTDGWHFFCFINRAQNGGKY